MVYRLYQVGLTVEDGFTPASLYEHISRVGLLDSVDLTYLEEDHVHEHRHLCHNNKQQLLLNKQ